MPTLDPPVPTLDPKFRPPSANFRPGARGGAPKFKVGGEGWGGACTLSFAKGRPWGRRSEPAGGFWTAASGETARDRHLSATRTGALWRKLSVRQSLPFSE